MPLCEVVVQKQRDTMRGSEETRTCIHKFNEHCNEKIKTSPDAMRKVDACCPV